MILPLLILIIIGGSCRAGTPLGLWALLKVIIHLHGSGYLFF